MNPFPLAVESDVLAFLPLLIGDSPSTCGTLTSHNYFNLTRCPGQSGISRSKSKFDATWASLSKLVWLSR